MLSAKQLNRRGIERLRREVNALRLSRSVDDMDKPELIKMLLADEENKRMRERADIFFRLAYPLPPAKATAKGKGQAKPSKGKAKASSWDISLSGSDEPKSDTESSIEEERFKDGPGGTGYGPKYSDHYLIIQPYYQRKLQLKQRPPIPYDRDAPLTLKSLRNHVEAQDTWLDQFARDFDDLQERLRETIKWETKIKLWEEIVERFVHGDLVQEKEACRSDLEYVWGIYNSLVKRIEKLEETDPVNLLDDFRLRLQDCASELRNQHSTFAEVDATHAVLQTRVQKLEGDSSAVVVSATESSRLGEQTDPVDTIDAEGTSQIALGKKRARDDDDSLTVVDDVPSQKVQVIQGLSSNVKQYVERDADGSVKIISKIFRQDG